MFNGSHIEHHLELFLQVKHFGYNNSRVFDSYIDTRSFFFPMKIKLWVSILSATLAEPSEHIMHSIKFEPTTPHQKSYKSKQLYVRKTLNDMILKTRS